MEFFLNEPIHFPRQLLCFEVNSITAKKDKKLIFFFPNTPVSTHLTTLYLHTQTTMQTRATTRAVAATAATATASATFTADVASSEAFDEAAFQSVVFAPKIKTPCKRVLVMCQRKTGHENDKKDVEKSVQEIENYTRELFGDNETVRIEYLSYFSQSTGTADYNFFFGSMTPRNGKANTITRMFVCKNRGQYDLVILYSSPFVFFVNFPVMYQSMREIMKPNSMLKIFHQSKKQVHSYTKQGLFNFTGWNQHFQEVQGVNDELLYITV